MPDRKSACASILEARKLSKNRCLRLTDEVWDAWVAYAANRGQTVSAMLQRAVLHMQAGDTQPEAHMQASVKPVVHMHSKVNPETIAQRRASHHPTCACLICKPPR